MRESRDEAQAKCRAALNELVEGKPEPFKALVVVLGRRGHHGSVRGFERGAEEVAKRLDWASAGIGASGRSVETFSRW
jgi:hypothetical protein